MIRDRETFAALQRELEELKERHASLDDDEVDRWLASYKRKFEAFRDRETELAAEEMKCEMKRDLHEFEHVSKAVWDEAAIEYADDQAERVWFRVSFALTTLRMQWVHYKWSLFLSALKWITIMWRRAVRTVREMAE